MYLKHSMTMVLALLVSGLFAQQQSLRILDIETTLPISFATYEYGSQSGTSDGEGTIELNYTAGNTLQLSHINYGSWILEDIEVKKALSNQVIFRKNIAVNLHPATVIALRPQELQPDASISLRFDDRLAHDGASILRQMPAFNTIRKGGNYGFDPVFRGFKYDQLNVVLNGAQSATAACPNRMDPPTSQMAPNMTDRIEVLKGPHALRYGTGFGATINFIPARLRFTPKQDVYGRVSGGYESNGNLLRGESRVGLTGTNYDFSLLGSWSQGDDYQDGNGNTVPADFTRGSFGANLGLKLSNNQRLSLSAFYNKARDADFPALPMDLRDDDTWLFNARHDIIVNREKLQSWNTTLYGSFVNHLMDNLLKPLDPRMMNASTEATTFNYGARTEAVWKAGKGKLFTGADFKTEGASGTRVREFLMGPMAGNSVEDNAWQDSYINKAALFAEYQIPFNGLQYVFSGRLEYNQANINDASTEYLEVYPDPASTQINPSISLGVIKDFTDRLQAGLWLGRAQRSAGLTERFINYFPVGQDPYEMLGNPELSPEVNNQVDLTTTWKNEKTILRLDVFAAYLQDYISSVIDTTLQARLPNSPGVRQFVNIDNAFKTGFEIRWSQHLVMGLQHQMGLAYTYGQDLEREEALPEIAPLDFRYALIGNYFKNSFRPEITFRYVAAQERISYEFGETTTPSFALVDLKVAYFWKDTFSVHVGVNNLLDEAYFEHLSRSVRGTPTPIYEPGRNFFASLSYKF